MQFMQYISKINTEFIKQLESYTNHEVYLNLFLVSCKIKEFQLESLNERTRLTQLYHISRSD